MYEATFPFILGLLLAWITWYPARFLPASNERFFFTAIVTIVTLGFLGFPLEDRDATAAAYELGAMVVLLVLVVMSWKVNSAILPLVWFGHGAWDFVYLLGLVPIDKPLWLVQMCVPYDWALAGYLTTRLPAWRESAAAK